MDDFKVTKANRAYQPYGGAKRLIECRDSECLLAGAAGTGKSVACLLKLYLVCHKYPGMRGLIVRKTRESLSEAALVTWEQRVVPEGHPMLSGAQRRMRQVYNFGNGSEIVVGGMDKAQKVMSTEYDCIYCQEGTELTEEDWESLTTRLRNGKMPYQQIIADCNPAGPRHWLKQRCEAKKTTMIDSVHEDNPLLFDQATGKITVFGMNYIAKLDALTGVRKQRLRFGKWVQAEGAVYEAWDEKIHVVDDFPIPPEWERFWAVDFGYVNPCCVQFWARDPDDRLYLFREFYKTKTLVEDVAVEVKNMYQEDLDNCRNLVLARLEGKEPDQNTRAMLDELPTMIRPRVVLADHDAEDRKTLEKHAGITTQSAPKSVLAGINAVAERLKVVEGTGKPRLMILRGARFNAPDDGLVEAKKPTCTMEEMEGYVWANSKTKEQPVKESDHGNDPLRYLAYHLSGRKPFCGGVVIG